MQMFHCYCQMLVIKSAYTVLVILLLYWIQQEFLYLELVGKQKFRFTEQFKYNLAPVSEFFFWRMSRCTIPGLFSFWLIYACFGITLPTQQPQPPYHSHYTVQPLLATLPVRNYRILLVQSFTACTPLLMAASIFGLGEKTLEFSTVLFTLSPSLSRSHYHYQQTISSYFCFSPVNSGILIIPLVSL